MSDKIKHSGIVENVMDGCVQVRIVQTSACAACKVAGYCNASESKEKLIDVYCSNSMAYKVGQSVMVTASTQVAAKALLMGFGLPFFVLVTVLFVVLQVTGNEGLAALSGIGALLPYYGVLYLFRDAIRDKLSFSVE